MKDDQTRAKKIKMKRHLFYLFILFILSLILLEGKVASINVKEKQTFQTSVLSQHVSKETSTETIPAKRGSIIDRNGTVLAESVLVYDVIYDPGVLNQYDEEIIDSTNDTVSKLLEGVSVFQLNTYLTEQPTNHYIIIGHGLEYEKIKDLQDAVNQNKLTGVFIKSYYERMYPYNSLAADVIGFYNNTTGGTYGIEEYYEDALKGEPGRMFGTLDDGNIVYQEKVTPQNGNDVILTIDYSIQRYVEQAITKFYEEHNAKSVNIIVMNPQNGQVLSMASSPTYNLNDPFNLTGAIDEDTLNKMSNEEKSAARYDLWKNFNVSYTYEPGSTYKPFTLVAALEEGRVTLDQTFECDGGKQVYDYYIKCWKDGGHGLQTTTQALANSCNVAFMDIGDLLGVDLYYSYQHMFGFGAKTNIDMLGEELGLLYSKEEMGPVELATCSFGQGFNVTPIQLITAFSSLINGGYLYEPTIMEEIKDENGHIVTDKNPKMIRQVISNETSKHVTTALQDVVYEGTGEKAQIPGYIIGGKTGTAQKGSRSEEHYIVSFIGFVPVDNPKLIMLVVIDEPDAEVAESSWAVSMFNDAMQKILPYKMIFPDTDVSNDENGSSNDLTLSIDAMDEGSSDTSLDKTTD